MKKSEMYRKMQYSVLKDPALHNIERLEMLKELMNQEELAKFCEAKDDALAAAAEEVEAK